MQMIARFSAMAVLLGTAISAYQPAFAQEAATGTEPAATGEPVDGATAGLYSAEDLDALFAPVALYPDSLLAQVLLATTYPVDVMQADRFLSKNAGLDDTARSSAVADQTWADPVRELAAGFPQLIARMAEHMDWTEQTGDAIVAQTDDVIASLQRLRAQAKLNGYLEDNEAMNVEEDPASGNITISSTSPEVVYVPEYTNVVYSQPAPATPVYVTNDDDWSDYLLTGAIVWGSAVILDEIFNDDDWGNSWYGRPGGGNDIDWNGDINVDNGINIGNGNGNSIGGIGDRPGLGDGGLGGGGLGGGGLGGGGLGDGGLRPGDLNRPTTLPGKAPGRLGDVDPDRLQDRKDGNFLPSDASRDAARDKIARGKAGGGGVATLPAANRKGDLGRVEAGRDNPKPKIAAKPKPAAKVDRNTVSSSKIAKPKAKAAPKAVSRGSKAGKAPAYKPSGGSRGKAASSRGSKSVKRNR